MRIAAVATLSALLALAATSSAGARDSVGPDDLVYREIPGYGYRFHPLASCARLNLLVSRGQPARAGRLAHVLVARADRRSGALYWEYDFAFGGPDRWTSGFAQAVAAQALARTAAATGDRALEGAAHRAFAALTRSHLRPLAGGSWILEYGFSDLAILNAQLQTLVSLDDFGTLTSSPHVQRTIARLDVATRALLRRFDTGCWSRYSLGGYDADLHYHRYHVRLLFQLASTRAHPVWTSTALRWSRYLRNRHLPCGER